MKLKKIRDNIKRKPNDLIHLNAIDEMNNNKIIKIYNKNNKIIKIYNKNDKIIKIYNKNNINIKKILLLNV